MGKELEQQQIHDMPTLEEWKRLYDAVLCFKELSPWNWMWDSDIFGVKNPIDGEIGYCCILGRNGEFFGLAVYLGSEGLDGYLKVVKEQINEEDDPLYLKKCLVASFENKSDLKKPDLEIIKNLSLEFKGPSSWPLFRNYQPGYLPWYLTREDATFLTLCLEQVNDISLRFKEDPHRFNSHDNATYLVRVRDNNLRWTDSWFKPIPFREIVLMTKTIDPKRVENITDSSQRTKQSWEVDFCYAPAYIAEKGKRPYFPITFLFVDSESFFVLNAHLTLPDKYRVEFHEQFLRTIENNKVIPEEVLVRKEELFAYLGPLADRLGFKVHMVKRLKSLDDARKHMFEYFGKREMAR